MTMPVTAMTITPPTTSPPAAPEAPSVPAIMITNPTRPRMTVINESTNMVTVTVGRNPYGVAVDASTGTVYVANHDDGSVSMITPVTAPGAPIGATGTPGNAQAPVVFTLRSVTVDKVLPEQAVRSWRRV